MTVQTTEMKLDVVCYSRYYVMGEGQIYALQMNFAAASTSAFRLTAHVTENQTVWIAHSDENNCHSISDVCVHFIRSMICIDIIAAITAW